MNGGYLSVNNLNFEYPDGYKALENVNLNLSKGERLAVLGPNGAGKTTLILHLNGIHGELKGEIKLNDISYSEKNISKIRKSVGLVFQDPDDQLFMPTVLEDVMFGPKILDLVKNKLRKTQLRPLNK
jgi:cobalt/nickel transport system ATP-binding protein